MTARRALIVIAGALSVTGCASTLITADTLTDRAAVAIGADSADLTIGQRTDEGSTTRFQVRTRSGQEYHCSIGVTVSVLGRQVTDALCNRKGEPAVNPLRR